MQQDKRLVPRLRFPEFKESWDDKTLGSICKNVAYGMNAAAKPFDGENQYLRITDIDESSRSFIPNPLSSPEGKIEDKYILKKGDIVFTRTGASVGKSYLYNENDGKLLYAGFLIKFSITKADPYFIFLQTFLGSYNKWVQVYSMRSGQPGLNAEEYKGLVMCLPKLSEQKKIANFLTAVDNRIQTLEKKKNLLEQYKKGVMQKIFNQELRFKDDEGDLFPQWERKRLGELTYKVGKKNKENIQYPIYSINNQEGFRPQSEQFEGLNSNERGYDISLYKIVNKETFAYNPARINVGSIGYSYELNEVIISSLYVCFKTNKELEDLYLLAYLDTDRFNKDILRYEEGGVRQYLFYENFSQIKIPLPSNVEQTKIANFLSAIDRKIALVNKKIEHTKTYKKGLLQQMFV